MSAGLFLIQEYNENYKKTSVTIPRCELLSLLQVNLCLRLRSNFDRASAQLGYFETPPRVLFIEVLHPCNLPWSCKQSGGKIGWRKLHKTAHLRKTVVCMIMVNAIRAMANTIALIIKWCGRQANGKHHLGRMGIILLFCCSFAPFPICFRIRTETR